MIPNSTNTQALNRYSYCFNNPLKYTDPTGHWPNWVNQFTQFVKAASESFYGAVVSGSVVGAAINVVNTSEMAYSLCTGQASISDYTKSLSEVIDSIKDEYNVSTAEGWGHIAGTVYYAAGTAAIGGLAANVKSTNGISNINEGHYLTRPYIRESTRKAIETKSIKMDDIFIDANTKKPIEGKYQLGHKYGHEYWKYRDWAESKGMTQEEFNEMMNNPEIYQIEDPLSNMSHIYEAPGKVFFGGN
jgi:hypothetical protein